MNTSKLIIPGGSASGTLSVPGDKSISIRAVLLSAIADGVSNLSGLSEGGDVVSAIKCTQQLGIEIHKNGDGSVTIYGNGLRGFKPTNYSLDCSNSGTTARLLTGILSGQHHSYTVTGDDSLQKRPMERIITPLRRMGASIKCLEKEGFIPYRITPTDLHTIHYTMPIASAQVKSAILLAGLYAQGTTIIKEPTLSRNHTEMMFTARGVDISINTTQKEISLSPGKTIFPANVHIPGDISGAAFFIVLATILPDSHIIIKNVGINPTRTGILEVLQMMGAHITITNHHSIGGEETADIEVHSEDLYGTQISGEIIPRIIDELPIVAVAGAFAEGTTIIRDAQELRVKETDRINAICVNLRKMGTAIEEYQDGLLIRGKTGFNAAHFDSFNDHRIAMAFGVAGTVLNGESTIEGSEWADISFPGYFSLLNYVRGIPSN
jgi:3-phosphoshikimate 1-carboxyvinyltransferase